MTAIRIGNDTTRCTFTPSFTANRQTLPTAQTWRLKEIFLSTCPPCWHFIWISYKEPIHFPALLCFLPNPRFHFAVTACHIGSVYGQTLIYCCLRLQFFNPSHRAGKPASCMGAEWNNIFPFQIISIKKCVHDLWHI